MTVQPSYSRIARPEPPGVARPVPPKLPELRFGLRQLFWFVSLLSVLLAGLVVADGVASLVLLLAVLIVVAHVTGTALGSRLRQHADDVRAWETTCERRNNGPSRPEFGQSHQTVCTPPSLGRRGIVLWWLWPLVIAAIALGAVLGAVLLEWTIGEHTSVGGVVVGALSMAVLGGWLAFLGGSFAGMLRDGWHEAIAAEHADQLQRKSAS